MWENPLRKRAASTLRLKRPARTVPQGAPVPSAPQFWRRVTNALWYGAVYGGDRHCPRGVTRGGWGGSTVGQELPIWLSEAECHDNFWTLEILADTVWQEPPPHRPPHTPVLPFHLGTLGCTSQCCRGCWAGSPALGTQSCLGHPQNPSQQNTILLQQGLWLYKGASSISRLQGQWPRWAHTEKHLRPSEPLATKFHCQWQKKNYF